MAYLKHYGTPRHSGRYPWGSGDEPQRTKSFGTRVSELKKEGMTEAKIAGKFWFKNNNRIACENTYGI